MKSIATNSKSIAAAVVKSAATYNDLISTVVTLVATNSNSIAAAGVVKIIATKTKLATALVKSIATNSEL